MNVKHLLLASAIVLPVTLMNTNVRAQIREVDLLEKATWIAQSHGFPCDEAIEIDSDVKQGRGILIVKCNVGVHQKTYHIDNFNPSDSS